MVTKEHVTTGGGLLPLVVLMALVFGAALGFMTVGVGDPVVIFLGVAGLVVTLLAVMRPDWGLTVVIFMAFTRFSDVMIVYHNAPSVMKWFVPLLVMAVLVRWMMAGERPRGWERPVVLMTVYGGIGVLSALYAQDADIAFETLSDYLKNAVIAIMTVGLLNSARTLRRVIWAMLAAGIFMGTLSTFQYLTGTFRNNYGGFAQVLYAGIVGQAESYRIAGSVGDPNFFAQVLVMLVPLGLDRLLNERSLVLRLLGLWGVMVCLLAILFTYSRGALVALMVLAIYSLLRYRRFVVGWVLAFLVMVVLAQYVIPQKYLARAEMLLSFLPGSTQNPLSEPAFRGRASEMQAAWTMFQANPILGVGIGNSSGRYVEYSTISGLTTGVKARAMHSLYLEIAAETGILGVATFGLVLFYMFRGMRRARSDLAAAHRYDVVPMIDTIEASVLAFCAGAMFLHGAYSRFFWLIAGIAFAMPNVAANEVTTWPGTGSASGGRL